MALFVETSPAVWRTKLDSYANVLSALSASKKKAKVPLTELDHWYQKTLFDSIASRDPRHMKHEELVQLVEWKLLRGKFRPRLVALAQSNSAQEVEECTRAGFALLPDAVAASKKLCELKGIGPATASAMLCAGSSGQVPFMADEAMGGVPGLGVAYTDASFRKFVSAMKEKADVLTAADETGRPWTPHMVELALWTDIVAPKVLSSSGEKHSTSAGTAQAKRKPAEAGGKKKKTKADA